MSRTQKIIGAALAAVTLTLGLLSFVIPETSQGQAAVGYPQAASATTVQPTLLTNVQIATIAIPGGAVLSANQVTNFPTGIIADTNAIILTSNPFTPSGASAAGASITTNNLTVYGQSSNGVVYVSVGNFTTNKITLPASLVKAKAESWQ